MIYSYISDDHLPFDLVPPAHFEDSRRNLFSSDSFTLVVGKNGAGKTHFLSRLADESIKKNSKKIVRDGSSSGRTSVVFYSASPYTGVRPRSRKIRVLGPNSKSVSPGPKLLASIGAAFSTSGYAEVMLSSSAESGVRAIASAFYEIPVNIRGALMGEMESLLNRYQELSRTWVSLKANGARVEEPAAKGQMLAAQREISAYVQGYFKVRLPIEMYMVLMHALDISIKNNPKKRLQYIQDLVWNVEGLDVMSQDLVDAIAEIKREINLYGAAILDGATVPVRRGAELKRIAQHSSLMTVAMGKGSSGSSALFDQFAKISNEVGLISGQGRELLLIIDEGDAYLHFEWQQKYIKYLDAFVRGISAGFSTTQVVVATHSPILMSDVPSDNVIRLGDENDKLCTFGAPLERIVGTTGQSGTIGEFAAEKIEAMLDGAAHVDQYMVNQIDDGFIKAELRRRLGE